MATLIPQKYRIYFLLFVIPFLLGIGIDLYVPSLPDIVTYFKTSQNYVQLTISLYMLGYAVGQIFLGILSDCYGRKKILVISGLFFTGASFLAVLSPNIFFLCFCRLLQGLGAAGLGSSIRAVPIDCFSGLSFSRAMTFITTSWAMGPIIGPFIGGYLQKYFDWKMSFYVYGFYSLFIVLIIAFMLKETNLCLSKFHPIKIYNNTKKIISHPFFWVSTLILSLIYSVLVVFNVIGPFLIQVTMNYSPVVYGRIAFILGLAYFLGNVFNQFVITYFNSISIAKTATIGAFLISSIMVFLGLYLPMNLYIFITPMFFLFLFCGFIFPNLMAKVFTLFPKIAGTVSAIYGFLFVCGVFLMTLFATTLDASSQMPLIFMYMIIFIICMILIFIGSRLDKRSAK